MHIAKPLVHKHNSFEAKTATKKLKWYKSPGTDHWQNWSKQQVMHYVLISTNLLILYGLRKNCHCSGRNVLLYLLIERVIKLTVAITERYNCYQLHMKFYAIFLLRTLYVDEIIGDHQCGFWCNIPTNDQVFCIHQILDKKVGV